MMINFILRKWILVEKLSSYANDCVALGFNIFSVTSLSNYDEKYKSFVWMQLSRNEWRFSSFTFDSYKKYLVRMTIPDMHFFMIDFLIFFRVHNREPEINIILNITDPFCQWVSFSFCTMILEHDEMSKNYHG